MNLRHVLVVTTVFATAVSAVAIGQANFKPKMVPGERWRQSVSMEMQGFKMPAQVTEACMPKDANQEDLAKPDRNCTLYDVQNRGNTFAAKMRCTGKDAMEGSIESTSEGNRNYGRMTAKSKDGEMVMSFDNTRLGTACQAEDWSDYVPPQVVLDIPPAVDTCKLQGENLGKYQLAGFVIHYTNNGQCSKHASKKAFCEAVKSPAGFHSLYTNEQQMAGVKPDADSGPNPPHLKPLLRSMEACELGTGAEATTRLQVSLLPVASANNDWGYLATYGDDETFANLVETARAQCSGRAYTTAASRRYARLCNPYGAALVRNDREAVRQIAANGYDPGPTAPAAAGNGDGATGVVDASGSGAAQQPAEAQPETTKDKAREALDAGKKALRGIFRR